MRSVGGILIDGQHNIDRINVAKIKMDQVPGLKSSSKIGWKEAQFVLGGYVYLDPSISRVVTINAIIGTSELLRSLRY
jgi:hypothetical protein